MRTLIYVPIIHTSADMGTLGAELRRKSASGIGENKWQKHTETVNRYWDAIESYFENIHISIPGIKIYQDGMFVDGETAIIINDGINQEAKIQK